MYKTLTNQKGTFSIWKSIEFWLKWYENELREAKGIVGGKEDTALFLLKNIINTMFLLKIDTVTIVNTILSDMAPERIKDVNIL